MEKAEAEIEELDQQLKKDITNEFDAFIKNRILIEKLQRENEAIQQILSKDPVVPKHHHNSAQHELKMQKEINTMNKNIYEMRTILYHIDPKLAEQASHLHASRHSHAFITDPHEKSHHSRKEAGGPILKHSVTSISSHNNVGGSNSGSHKNQKSHVLDEDEEKLSVEHNANIKQQEIALILKHFDNDTIAIQDLVLAEMKHLETSYEDKR